MSRPVLSRGGFVTIPRGASFTLASIPVHAIALPDNYVGMDLGHIESLVALLAAGDQTPPPTLAVEDEGTGRPPRYWVVEGRHRFIAHLIAGRHRIDALVGPVAIVQVGDEA